MSVRYWRHPGALAWILLLAGLALFGRLGFWQLDRAREKTELLAAFDDVPNMPVQDFNSVRDSAPTGHYPHVRIHGRFDSAHSYLWDNQIRDGRAGVQVFVPFFNTEDERALLVNLGWLARSDQTRITPQLPALPQGEIELRGIYAPMPGSGIRLGGNALRSQSSWPKLTIYIEADDIAKDSGHPLYTRQLLLDAEPDSAFVREWTPNVMPPMRHQAYAFQWFALALAVLVIFIMLHCHKMDRI